MGVRSPEPVPSSVAVGLTGRFELNGDTSITDFIGDYTRDRIIRRPAPRGDGEVYLTVSVVYRGRASKSPVRKGDRGTPASASSGAGDVVGFPAPDAKAASSSANGFATTFTRAGSRVAHPNLRWRQGERRGGRRQRVAVRRPVLISVAAGYCSLMFMIYSSGTPSTGGEIDSRPMLYVNPGVGRCRSFG